MKKIINLVKEGTTYQVGAVTEAEITQIKTDISSALTQLQNVYTKTETDNAIDTKIGQIDKEIFVFTDELPTTDIKTNKIYVVPTQGATGESNSYTEWLRKGDTWEKIGEFKSDQDLSNIYTKAETDAAIQAAIQGLDGNWIGTQAEYEALTEKNPNTMYWIYQEE